MWGYFMVIQKKEARMRGINIRKMNMEFQQVGRLGRIRIYMSSLVIISEGIMIRIAGKILENHSRGIFSNKYFTKDQIR